MMVKKIAVYGTYQAKVPVFQRFWKWIRHRKGPKTGQKWYKRRVWKKTKRMKKTVRSDARYEFQGRGRDLYKAVVLGHHFMPKGLVDVSAKRFLEHPEEYGFVGEWVEKEVES